MDFYAVFEQVFILLQWHGPASHRAPNCQFDLDDDDLDELRAEVTDLSGGALWASGRDVHRRLCGLDRPHDRLGRFSA